MLFSHISYTEFRFIEGQKWASNTTSVDMYIKKDKIDEVKQSLNNASMDFRILVENVQQAIDEENPPLRSEELNEFTTRKGELRSISLTIRISARNRSTLFFVRWIILYFNFRTLVLLDNSEDL